MKKILLAIVFVICCSWNCFSQGFKTIQEAEKYFKENPVLFESNYLCGYKWLSYTDKVYTTLGYHPKGMVLLESGTMVINLNGQETIYPIYEYKFEKSRFEANLGWTTFIWELRKGFAYLYGDFCYFFIDTRKMTKDVQTILGGQKYAD